MYGNTYHNPSPFSPSYSFDQHGAYAFPPQPPPPIHPPVPNESEPRRCFWDVLNYISYFFKLHLKTFKENNNIFSKQNNFGIKLDNNGEKNNNVIKLNNGMSFEFIDINDMIYNIIFWTIL